MDFGGLEWEWMPIRANEKYEKWLEDNVLIRSHARCSEKRWACGIVMLLSERSCYTYLVTRSSCLYGCSSACSRQSSAMNSNSVT